MTTTDPAWREIAKFARKFATGDQQVRPLLTQLIHQFQQQTLMFGLPFQQLQIIANQKIQPRELFQQIGQAL